MAVSFISRMFFVIGMLIIGLMSQGCCGPRVVNATQGVEDPDSPRALAERLNRGDLGIVDRATHVPETIQKLAWCGPAAGKWLIPCLRNEEWTAYTYDTDYIVFSWGSAMMTGSAKSPMRFATVGVMANTALQMIYGKQIGVYRDYLSDAEKDVAIQKWVKIVNEGGTGSGPPGDRTTRAFEDSDSPAALAQRLNCGDLGFVYSTTLGPATVLRLQGCGPAAGKYLVACLRNENWTCFKYDTDEPMFGFPGGFTTKSPRSYRRFATVAVLASFALEKIYCKGFHYRDYLTPEEKEVIIKKWEKVVSEGG